MFPGQWIHVGASGSTTLWSPWFARGADNAIFTYEQMVLFGGGMFAVSVYHKNSEDTGNGAVATSGTFSQVASTTFRTSTPFEDLEELVRFQYSLGSEGTASSVLFRMLPTTWIPQAT